MDTKSAYIAIAAEKLEDLPKPDLYEDYQRNKQQWFLRTDMDEQKQYDKRTPDMFKVEWVGEGIVALNSKMYYCFGRTNKESYSCKGINQKRNAVRKVVYVPRLTKGTHTTLFAHAGHICVHETENFVTVSHL